MFQKEEEKAQNGRFSPFQTSVPSCANILWTFVCIPLPNTVTKLFNQIWIHDVTDVAYYMSRFVVVCTESSQRAIEQGLRPDVELWHMHVINYFTEVRFQISS